MRSCCSNSPGGMNRKGRTGKQAHIRFVQQALFCPKVAGVTEALTADNDDTTQFAAEPSWDILSSWKGITRLSWPKTSSTQKPACQPQYLLIRGLSQERGDSLSYGTKLPRSETSLPPSPGIDPQQRERSPWAYAPRIQYTPNRWRSQVLYVRLGEGKRNRFLESLDWGHWPPTTIYMEKVLCYPYSTQ